MKKAMITTLPILYIYDSYLAPIESFYRDD